MILNVGAGFSLRLQGRRALSRPKIPPRLWGGKEGVDKVMTGRAPLKVSCVAEQYQRHDAIILSQPDGVPSQPPRTTASGTVPQSE